MGAQGGVFIMKWHLGFMFLSAIIALVVAYVGLCILFSDRIVPNITNQTLCGVTIGLAVCSMHYTGMLSATYKMKSVNGIPTGREPTLQATTEYTTFGTAYAISIIASVTKFLILLVVESFDRTHDHAATCILEAEVTLRLNRAASMKDSQDSDQKIMADGQKEGEKTKEGENTTAPTTNAPQKAKDNADTKKNENDSNPDKKPELKTGKSFSGLSQEMKRKVSKLSLTKASRGSVMSGSHCSSRMLLMDVENRPDVHRLIHDYCNKKVQDGFGEPRFLYPKFTKKQFYLGIGYLYGDTGEKIKRRWTGRLNFKPQQEKIVEETEEGSEEEGKYGEEYEKKPSNIDCMKKPSSTDYVKLDVADGSGTTAESNGDDSTTQVVLTESIQKRYHMSSSGSVVI